MIYNAENTLMKGNPMRVYVDGKEIKYCKMADTGAGYVIACVVGHDGDILIDGGEVKTERIEGVVTVVPAIDD